ncbi:MAG: ABC transporter ATP-binding protein [Pseudomonadota bacterium]
MILETAGLTRHYGGVTAVSDVALSIPEGEIRALIGPNGAGKSTLVGLISGRVAASAGSVRFLGDDISHLPAHARIARGMAYTFQITSIFARLSLAENVALALRRRSPAEIDATLDRVGLADRAEDLAGDLSYGHQRLLEIAMGLAQSPRLLILDEPTQGLAEAEIARFNTLIRGLPDTTILLIEHNMGVVMELADRITVLNLGEILAEGPPAEIRANRAVQAAYLGEG